MPAYKTTRRRFIREIRKNMVIKVTLVICSVLSAISVLPILLPPEQAKRVSLYPFFSKWDWHVWTTVLLVLLLLMFVESFFQFHKSSMTEKGILEDKLKEQEHQTREADATLLRKSEETIKLTTQLQHTKGESEQLANELMRYRVLVGEPETLRYKVAQLAHELLVFLAEKGPKPEYPKGATQDERVEWAYRTVLPFNDALSAGYALRFAHRLESIRNELQEQGLTDRAFNVALEAQVRDVDNISGIAKRLLGFALEINFKNSGLPARPTSESLEGEFGKYVHLTDKDPKVVPECYWDNVKYDQSIYQDRPIVFFNRGGSDAKDIKAETIVTEHGEAEFDSIGYIAQGKFQEIMPRIYGPNHVPEALFGVCDLLHLMDKEWDFVTGEPIIKLKIVVKYKDSSERPLVTTANLTRNPLRGTTVFEEYKFMRLVTED